MRLTFDPTNINLVDDTALEAEYKRVSFSYKLFGNMFGVAVVVAVIVGVVWLLIAGIGFGSNQVTMVCLPLILFALLVMIPTYFAVNGATEPFNLVTEECRRRALAKALPSVNRIMDGRLYKGEDAEIIDTDEGYYIVAQLCRTSSGNWFGLTISLDLGKTDPSSVSLNPVSDAAAKKQFESKPEQFRKFFGEPEIA